MTAGDVEMAACSMPDAHGRAAPRDADRRAARGRQASRLNDGRRAEGPRTVRTQMRTNKHKGKRPDLNALRALIASGASVQATARQLGASEATLRRSLARTKAEVISPP